MHLRYFILCFLLSAAFKSFGQTDSAYQRAVTRLIQNRATLREFQIPPSIPGHQVLLLQTPFAMADFSSTTVARKLDGKIIEKIQLVFTTYALAADFDQNSLNGRRLKNLFAMIPAVFESPFTEWELIGQTGASSPEEGRAYFHGFVIHWRPTASPQITKEELRMLDSLFTPVKITGGEIPSPDGKPLVPGEPFPDGSVRVLTKPDGSKLIVERDIPQDSLRFYLKPSGPGYTVIDARYADSTHLNVIVTEMHSGGTKQKRSWKFEAHKSGLSIPSKITIDPDSVVLTVLGRNSWQNMALVCDVTSSMSPYTAQLFYWLRYGINSGRCRGFVFFNDGDGKKTSQKFIGKTGGIYGTASLNYDTVLTLAKKCMRAGDGDDTPENDLEAILWTMQNIPEGREIILLADNWATPRDLSLFEKINRPVRIVLCGARGGVNPAYLFLARKTGGSVHTLTDDVTNLSTMEEGDVVKVGFQNFLLHDDRFIPLENFRKW